MNNQSNCVWYAYSVSATIQGTLYTLNPGNNLASYGIFIPVLLSRKIIQVHTAYGQQDETEDLQHVQRLA